MWNGPKAIARGLDKLKSSLAGIRIPIRVSETCVRAIVRALGCAVCQKSACHAVCFKDTPIDANQGNVGVASVFHDFDQLQLPPLHSPLLNIEPAG